MSDAKRTWDVTRLLGLARPDQDAKKGKHSSTAEEIGQTAEDGLPREVRRLTDVSVDSIVPNPYQPRRHFDEEDLQDLARSIAEVGVIQPLVVCEAESGGYELVAGERRLRASRIAGLETVPVVVIEVEAQEQELFALVENLQRRDLTSIEEARSFQGIMERTGWSQTELARRLGRSQSAVANKLRLLSLSPGVQEFVREGRLGERHARTLLQLASEDQEPMARKVLEEGLTVRDLEKAVKSVGSQKSGKERRTRRKKLDLPGMEGELLQDLMDLTALFRERGLPVSLKVREKADDEMLFEVKVRRKN